MDADGCSEFYSEATRKARKPYRCCECRRDIAIGDLYVSASGKWEGDFFTERTCVECDEIRSALCCGWVFGQLWESIRDQVFPYWNEMTAIDCLAKLKTDAAIAKMRAEYARYREGFDF